MRQGICIPISFYCEYRGKRYKEVNLYFSRVPIEFEDVNLEHPDRTKAKDIELLKNKIQQNYDYLVPYTTRPLGGHEISSGKKYSIGCIDSNPTTATFFTKVGLMPCTHNNLSNILALSSHPNFYLGKRGGIFNLYIKDRVGEYQEIPQQKQAIATWDEVAHPQITFNQKSCPDHLEDIDWIELLDEINQSG